MCEDCSKLFSDYYFEPIPLVLEESILARKLLANTDPGRTERGNYSIISRKDIMSPSGKEKHLRIDFNYKSLENTERRRHYGYVIFEPNKAEVSTLFCDCSDFHARLYAPMVKAGLATFKLEPKYQNRDVDRALGTANWGKHNQKWTKKTNPSGKLYLCKHLFYVVKNFVLNPTEEELKKQFNIIKKIEKVPEKVEKKIEKPIEKKVEKPVEKKVPDKKEPVFKDATKDKDKTKPTGNASQVGNVKDKVFKDATKDKEPPKEKKSFAKEYKKKDEELKKKVPEKPTEKKPEIENSSVKDRLKKKLNPPPKKG
jgi:hypothetical protein